jgi:hypothetical protein
MSISGLSLGMTEHERNIRIAQHQLAVEQSIARENDLAEFAKEVDRVIEENKKLMAQIHAEVDPIIARNRAALEG